MEEEKYRSPKDTGAATTISRPPAGGTLHPPAHGAKVTSPGGAAPRPLSMLIQREATKPTPAQRSSSPALGAFSFAAC